MRNGVHTAPRAYQSICTYRCWNCRTLTRIRYSFTIVWRDDRPHRAYDRLQFQVAPVCQVCRERLDFLSGRDDDDKDHSRCAALCVPAKNPRTICQCQTCHGARHGEARHA